MTTVSELMTGNVRCVRSTEALDVAAKIMWDYDCGIVPVLEPAGERVIGVITDRDICMAAWSRDCALSTVPVSSAMSRELHYCSPSDDIHSAQALMGTRQLRRLPVLDSTKRLVGILSIADIARAARPSGMLADNRPTELASTLSQICESQLDDTRISA
jgi:CBS domain-containing protein